MHIIESFIDIIQFLMMGNEFVYPESSLEVVCISAPNPFCLQSSVFAIEEYRSCRGGEGGRIGRTINNTGHLGPSLDSSEC
jgi:hypothetical protein